MNLDKVYDELMAMIDDLRAGQRMAEGAIASLKEQTRGAQERSGNPISISDAAPINAEALTVTLEPIQSGSGDPSPTNIRPITGYTECEVVSADAASDPTASNTATISFGQTVYGGSVDFKTGAVTIDCQYAAYDGSEDWTMVSAGAGGAPYFRIAVNDASTDSTGACSSHFPWKTITSTNTDIGWRVFIPGGSTTTYIAIRPVGASSMAHVSDFTTWLAAQNTAGTPVQVCYDLAAAITLQLTPQELKLLKGTNNITTNGTTIRLTYQPDNVMGQILAVSEADDVSTLNAAKAYADSVVTITPALESGTKLVDYTISGTAGVLYGPSEQQATRKTTVKKSTKEE